MARVRGFTLIELLVVVSIIALLIGVLLPALAAARDDASMVRCLAASRQLMQSYLGYATESKGRLIPGHYPANRPDSSPVFDDRGNPLNSDEDGNRWVWRLAGYTHRNVFGSILVNEQARAFANRDTSNWAYNVSLYPSFGLNTHNIGGYYTASNPASPVINLSSPGCLGRVSQAHAPSRLITFATAGATSMTGGTTPGYWRISDPRRPYEASATGWSSDRYVYPDSGPPDRWGWVHPRWHNKAVTAELDGHSELQSMEQMRDMTRWSNRAAELSDPNWSPTSP